MLDNAGNATFAGTAAMASSFLRNRIINGAMAIDQRNAGASFSSGVGAVTYGLDRFYVFSSGAAVTGQRVNPSLTGFPNALRVTGAAGATYTEVGQRIESANIADLAGSTVIVSFWAASSSVTSISVYANYANTQDNFGATTTIGFSPVSITSTLTRYTVSFALPSQAANGIVVGFQILSGLTSGTFTLTGVQLEVGSVATPFERRQFGHELELCQRYFYKSFDQGQVPGVVGMISCRGVVSSSGFRTSHSFKHAVTMRATPTIVLYNPTTGAAGSARIEDGNLNGSATPFIIGQEVLSGIDVGSASAGNAVLVAYTASAEL